MPDAPRRTKELVRMHRPDRFDLWIGGVWKKASKYVPVATPYDGKCFAEVPESSASEMEQAIAAAAAAREKAASLVPFERYRLLMGAARKLEENHALFAETIALESGKPLREAKVEVDRSIQTLQFSAEEAKRVRGEMLVLDAHPAGKGRTGFTLRVPRGVIGCITPFNFPLNLVCHKVGPALASGNTVVVKPAEETPCSAFLLAMALAEAGCPDGFVNVAPGLGEVAGETLVKHRDVAMLSFTGSRAVGTHLRAIAGLKPVTLELGGNAAVVIDGDASWQEALDRFVIGGFSHSGQVCIHLQRIYAAGGARAGDVVDALAARAKALKIGHPLDESAEITSLIRVRDVERVGEWVGEAKRMGAAIAAGGERQGRSTYLPTVLADIKPGMKVSEDEVFGPVVGVAQVDTFEEAIAAANRTRYGLQAAVFTRDLEKALRAAERIEAGGIMINDVPTFRVDQMPYGGMKESGLGREGPQYACEEMTELKTIAIRRTIPATPAAPAGPAGK
jgi:acyl-CoA reductase-like NAD-dependent aldehyde dehydrogenase